MSLRSGALSRLVLLALLAAPAAATAQSVPIVFQYPVADDPSQIYIQFLGGNVTGTYRDTTGTQQSVQANTAYSLAEITSPVSVGGGAPANVPALLMSDVPGRLYINFANPNLMPAISGLSGMGAPGSGYIPAANASGDANYEVRYQYVEPGISGAQVNADLSYIDFVSIALSMEAVNAPNAINNPQNSAGCQAMVTAAADAGTPPNAGVLPSPADILPSASFARVISPGLGATGDYHDFTHYLQTTLQGVTVRIAGTYTGTGTQPGGTNPPWTQAQSYDFDATFDASGNLTMTANTGSGNGSAPGVPAMQQGAGIGDVNQTITVTFTDLNAPTGIYGNNPPFTFDDNGSLNPNNGGMAPTALTNDVIGRVLGDLLAGLSYGFPGSPQTVGLASTEWWGGTMPDGTVIAPGSTLGGMGTLFSALQSNPLDYNVYAGNLRPLTSGYAFSLGDRLGANLLTFNTQTDANSYLRITISSDCTLPAAQPTPTPTATGGTTPTPGPTTPGGATPTPGPGPGPGPDPDTAVPALSGWSLFAVAAALLAMALAWRRRPTSAG